MEETVTRLVRPKALRVAPAASSAAELFYEEAHAQQLSLKHVHRAVADTHDWQHKWDPTRKVINTNRTTTASNTGATPADIPTGTLDDNVHSTHEHQHQHDVYGYQDSPSAELPYHYAYQGNPRDETGGAHNPSPPEEHAKRPREWPRTNLSQRVVPQRAISPDQLSDITDEENEGDLSGNPPKDMKHALYVIKPVPLRIVRPIGVRPVLVRPEPIPPQIFCSSSSIGGSSPLTIPSILSYHQTVNQEEAEETWHYISDDEPEQPPPTERIQGIRTSPDNIPWAPEDTSEALRDARDGILHALATGKEPEDEAFQHHLQVLQQVHAAKQLDTRQGNATHGMWLTLTKPNFFGCLGENDQGDALYTLGRMTFDMFSPNNLVCSLQGNFNSVERVMDADEIFAVPKALQEEVTAGTSCLRTYNVVTAFTIEPSLPAYPDAPNKDVQRPIRGIMTTYGYTLPDPDTPDRLSVWITGGRIEPNDNPADQEDWHTLFQKHPPKYSMGAHAKFMALKWLMGAEIDSTMADDGSFEYNFSRPIGGHGMAYVDTLYVDESIRVVRGHRGTIFVFSRLHR